MTCKNCTKDAVELANQIPDDLIPKAEVLAVVDSYRPDKGMARAVWAVVKQDLKQKLGL